MLAVVLEARKQVLAMSDIGVACEHSYIKCASLMSLAHLQVVSKVFKLACLSMEWAGGHA